MSISSYLEAAPLNYVAKYEGCPPKDAVAFIGLPKQHPSDKNKIILIYDPLGQSPALLELKNDDIVFAEDLHSAVTEQGEGVPLAKFWIRTGAYVVILEPFEVGGDLTVERKVTELRERFFAVKNAENRPIFQ
ncbi:hypothetical protein ACYULU_12545 [Breznakiellaceae bacterium SP9]